MKAYVYEIGTAVVLLGVVEIYLWSQSRSLTLDNTSTKIVLIVLYALVAAASQFAISSGGRYQLKDALKANVLVAAVISIGVSILVFFVHRGVVKDVSAEWTSIVATSLKFFMTLGLATLALRMLVAVVARISGSAASPK